MLYEGLKAIPELELPWAPDLTVVPFRLRDGDDAANQRLLAAINASKRVVLSSTVLDGRFTLRACILSHRTHRDRIDECIEIVGPGRRRRPPLSAPEIRTERLVLRPIEREDAGAFARLYSDPEVVRFVGDGTVATPEETVDWVERAIARNESEGFDMRAVLLGGDVIGRCGIAVWDIEGRAEREVGYILAREHWGKGYATEAATAMRDHALAGLGMRRLIALIQHGNEASERVASKLGMEYERDVPFHGRRVRMFSLET